MKRRVVFAFQITVLEPKPLRLEELGVPEEETFSAERVQEEVAAAFATTDSIHEGFMELGVGDEAEE